MACHCGTPWIFYQLFFIGKHKNPILNSGLSFHSFFPKSVGHPFQVLQSIWFHVFVSSTFKSVRPEPSGSVYGVLFICCVRNEMVGSTLLQYF